MTSEEFTVSFGSGVADVMAEVIKMIGEARHWAAGMQWADDMDVHYDDIETWRTEYAKVQKLVEDMELSWYRSFFSLVQMASNQGDMCFSWDAADSLFWIERKTARHHAGHVSGKYEVELYCCVVATLNMRWENCPVPSSHDSGDCAVAATSILGG